jgi:hypothetical protein
MTESEWLACGDPYALLDFLARMPSGRKLRLFACGCCRQRIWHLLTDGRSRDAVETAEQYADGLVTRDVLRTAWLAACEAVATVPLASGPLEGRRVPRFVATAAAFATYRSHRCAREVAARVFHVAYYGEALYDEARRVAEWASHVALVRCVFGNPFRPLAADRRWLTTTVVALAQAIYDDRAFDRLPVLADALEDAGCTDADLLDHCRGPGPHVRGCWAVDLLLLKG